MVVSCSNLLNPSFTIESLSNSFIGLYKLVKFLGKLLILMSDHSDMIVQGINFNLQIRVVVKQCRVAIPCSLKLLSHVHDLVLLRSDFTLQVLDLCVQVDVSGALRVNTLLKISVLVSVLFFERLEMAELILEANDLILKLNYFTLAVYQLRLFVFQIEGLGVDQFVEVVNSCKLLGDIVLKSSSLSGKVRTLLTLELVLVVELVDLLGVLSVPLTEVLELLLEVLFLLQELVV